MVYTLIAAQLILPVLSSSLQLSAHQVIAQLDPVSPQLSHVSYQLNHVTLQHSM